MISQFSTLNSFKTSKLFFRQYYLIAFSAQIAITMPLTNYEEFGLRLHYFLHRLLWPLPVTWRPDYKQLRLTKHFVRCIPFILMQAFLFVFGLANLFIMFLHYAVKPIPKFGRENVVIFCIFAACSLGTVTISVRAAPILRDLVSFVNNFLNITDEAVKGTPDLRWNHCKILKKC